MLMVTYDLTHTLAKRARYSGTFQNGLETRGEAAGGRLTVVSLVVT